MPPTDASSELQGVRIEGPTPGYLSMEGESVELSMGSRPLQRNDHAEAASSIRDSHSAGAATVDMQSPQTHPVPEGVNESGGTAEGSGQESVMDGAGIQGGTDRLPELEAHSPRQVPGHMVSVLDDIPGFSSGNIGGKDGFIYEVTTLANEGPGSLREGLESDTALWILFAEELNGTIHMDGRIYVRSYKTVDARGHDITLKAVRNDDASQANEGWLGTGLWLSSTHQNIDEVRDVVFLNLSFDGGWSDASHSGRGANAINIRGNVKHIWIHKCSFSNWIQGAISALRERHEERRPRRISITQSLFIDMDEAVLLESKQTTFARNLCDRVGSRCIKLDHTARAHSVNNVIRAWQNRSIISSRNGSQLFVDHVLFEPTRYNLVGKSSDSGETMTDGTWQSLHTYNVDDAELRFRQQGNIEEDFKRDAQEAYGHQRLIDCEHDPPDHACWLQLLEEVESNAGPTN